ncbi:nuclear transport factor 2 family protein [Jidongwangia harbinensis]|uniref:nuclear transport factor 2 family protein n=1 Tax=Jidongwangia harbinensis TaxID=2878561 RepID=UPI001CDA130D|nr:nuclear transport factor 2 family protein [Jidongwangia harbinensis]MCA2211821.1 nuclear transport factor 2 family protein [Jidongwangia harbinensis]
MTATDSATDRATRNKEIILRCYEQFFTHRDLTGLAEVVGEDFVQHSPGAPSGRRAYLDHLAEAAFFGGTSHIKLVLADGDHVAVHHHMTLAADDGPGLAVVDLWRLENGRIVEHWDVEQPVPEPSSVPNGMF